MVSYIVAFVVEGIYVVLKFWIFFSVSYNLGSNNSKNNQEIDFIVSRFWFLKVLI